MKKVLLLGDSIRMSYEPYVIEKLKDIALAGGPKENCGFAKNTLWNLNKWLIDIVGAPDIVHWNNGIWDVFRLDGEDGVFTPLDEYFEHIKRLHRRLASTKAQIIWATTTPVKDNYPRCHNEDIERYNNKVNEYMIKENIPINDLNKVIKQNRNDYISEDKLHLSEKGILVCAEVVVEKIQEFI